MQKRKDTLEKNMNIENKAQKIEIVSVEKIKKNPKNPNKHPQEQIDRLAKIISVQGFRVPLIVSNQSGLLIVGHGRLEAALQLGIKELPVIYEDFESPEIEYAHMTADNALNNWSSLDLAQINFELGELGPDFDVDLLGLKDFRIDASEKTGSLELNPQDFEMFSHKCPRCGFEFNSSKVEEDDTDE